MTHCEYVTGGVRCERLASSVLEDRHFCWEHALLRRMEDTCRASRDLFNELLTNDYADIPKSLLDRIRYQAGLLTYILEDVKS
jgi:hypothetical protein